MTETTVGGNPVIFMPSLHARASASVRPVLSAREQETLRYIAEGCTYLQTARRMGITVHTVDTYLRRIRSKFGINSKAELTRLAIVLKL